jgi:hypothetical protein
MPSPPEAVNSSHQEISAMCWGILQPSLTVPQQLLYFVFSDPMVLVGIEHWNWHIEMGEQVLQRDGLSYLDGVIRPFAPFGELFIQRMMLGTHPIAKRLEQLDHFSGP